MIMADVLKIVLLILATMLVFQAHWIASYALFPKQVERCRELYGRPIMLTFLGLVSIGPLILLGVFLAQKADKNPAIQLFSLVLFGIPTFLAMFGSAGLATRIGAGMASDLDETAPWRRTMRGGIILTLCYLLPFAGWFFLTGWTLISGAGAALIVMLKRSPKDKSGKSELSLVSEAVEEVATQLPQKMS